MCLSYSSHMYFTLSVWTAHGFDGKVWFITPNYNDGLVYTKKQKVVKSGAISDDPD